jgi:rifampicin phosphotransferase
VSTTDVVFPAPDEIEGFWNLDRMHAPRPITPLSFDLIIETLAAGFTKAQAEYDCPIMVTPKEINHYVYVSFHPVDDQAEIADRLSRYQETLAEKVPKVGKLWDEEWKPVVISKNYPAKTADYSSLSDAEMVTKLEEFVDHMTYQWWIHGHINFVLLSSSAFCDMYDEEMQPKESTEAYQVLQGFHTRSVDVSRAMWALSRLVKSSPTLSKLFAEKPSNEIVGQLDESEDGRAFHEQLRTFLEEFGWRSDAVYDLADIPWREDESIALSSIAGFVGLDDTEDPELLYRKAVSQRERLLAEARSKLSNEPEKLEKFNELYEAARYSFPVTEDHAFYIDQLGVGVFRRFALAVGQRLVDKGVVDQPDDVFFLRGTEVPDALLKGGDRRAEVAARRATFEAAGKVVAPGAVGTPPEIPADAPSDPFMDAIVYRLLGMVPPDDNPDPNIIRAVAGSPGVVTAKARVVRSLAEAQDLEEGEVMVCEMTLPPWVPLFSIAGAVVADVGGVLSHCAIVAREFGVPAVVGAVTGTTAIKTGQTITVDGNNGLVYLDGRSLA